MINFIRRVLHVIPFMHFYGKWSDPKENSRYGDYERQTRYCVICNKKQYRTVDNY